MSLLGNQEAARVAHRLAELGIPSPATNAYACLLTRGSMKASVLAAAAGISRHDAYRDLAILVRHGLASATLTRPLKYVPTDPHEALQMLYRRSTRRAEMVRVSSQDLAPALHKIRSPPHGKLELPLRIVGGRQKTYEFLHDMLSDARRDLLVVNSHPAAVQLATQMGLWQRVQQRAEAGLQIRILLRQGSAIGRQAERPTNENCQIRLMELDEMIRFAIADQQRMLFFTSVDPSPWEEGSDTAFSTTAPSFIQMEHVLFWRLWDEAEPLG